jgi:hypothetical protein
MTTRTLTQGRDSAVIDRPTGSCFILLGITFVAGGVVHPGDSGEGNKVDQMHEMLLNPAWYPSHLLLLVSFAAFATALVLLRRRAELPSAMARLMRIAIPVAVVATVGMAVHLFQALNVDATATGEWNWALYLQAFVEGGLDTAWALTVAAVAVIGGRTRTLGTRLIAPLGVVGGLCFALASATIAFTDLFDPLFVAGTLVGLWALLVGLSSLRRHA